MLSIRDLTKTYADGHQALRGVTLDIPAGIYGLLGPNGAGKSTLMRTLATLQRPDEGSISFDGLDLLANPEAAREMLGYLPQDFGFYPRATALSMLDHFAVLKGVADRPQRRELVEGLLARVNLWKVRHQRLHGFSGGMRQRLGIAQALIGQPRLIIVDDPTAGLDPEERHRVLDLLATCGENAVVILSTHLVEDVADLCPRMAMLVAGKVCLESTPAEAIHALRGRLWKMPAPPIQRDTPADGAILCTRRMSGARVAFAIAPSRPSPAWSTAIPDLEHVFFSVVGGCAESHQAGM